MSWLAVVITHYSEVVYQFVIVLCCQVYASLSIFSVLCPCPLYKKRLLSLKHWQKIYTLYTMWASIVIDCLRHILHLRKVSKDLRYFFSLFSMFLCLKMNKPDSLLLLVCYRSTRFTEVFQLMLCPSCYMCSGLLFAYRHGCKLLFNQKVKPCLGFLYRVSFARCFAWHDKQLILYTFRIHFFL